MAGLVEGKVVSVTGAGSGIGRATAILAAQEGAVGVIVNDLNAETLAETADQVRAIGVDAGTLVEPINSAGAPDRLVALAVEKFGRLDCAVNNAGTVHLETIENLTDEDWERIQAINTTSVFQCMRAQFRQMFKQDSGGAIANVASASVFGVHPALSAYVASKTAVTALTKVGAVEGGPHGVRVNAVAPGGTATPMRASYTSQGGEFQIGPLGRTADPSELANALLWLVCDRSSYVTGQTLVVDGGRTVG